MTTQTQYWVVGSTLIGASAKKTFVDRGYWQLGTNSKVRADTLYMERFNQIRVGDRIALKSLAGKGTALIKIHAIGIVKDVAVDERRVYIDWVRTELNRHLALNGCMDAISTPYDLGGKDKDWINDMFRI